MSLPLRVACAGARTRTHKLNTYFFAVIPGVCRVPAAGVARLVGGVKAAVSRGETIPQACQQYLDCVYAVNPPGSLLVYPGSPTLLHMHCREGGAAHALAVYA